MYRLSPSLNYIVKMDYLTLHTHACLATTLPSTTTLAAAIFSDVLHMTVWFAYNYILTLTYLLHMHVQFEFIIVLL